MADDGDEELPCARCGRAVRVNRSSYALFEGMHYVCFHYEFEHWGDPDEPCEAGGCPSVLFGAVATGPAPGGPPVGPARQ
jgi:hypothetical protein